MESKFTPGPWATDIDLEVIARDGLHATVYVNHGSGKGSEIAKFANEPENGLDPTSKETKANARLIAASPKMYSYIAKRAEEGDTDAAEIIASI